MSDDLTPPPPSEWPLVQPGGRKIACPLCIDATGWPYDESFGSLVPTPQYWWTRRHAVEHVRCECGVIRTPEAMPAHQRSASHQGRLET